MARQVANRLGVNDSVRADTGRPMNDEMAPWITPNGRTGKKLPRWVRNSARVRTPSHGAWSEVHNHTTVGI
jgi:hypothetical protein